MDKDTKNLIIILLVIFGVILLRRRGLLSGAIRNAETWEIHRNPDGSLKDIEIHRDVRRDA